MTTFAPQDTERRQAELAERTREAWTAYRDDLHGLEGRDYADAEGAAWDQLQAALHALDAERAEILAAGTAH